MVSYLRAARIKPNPVLATALFYAIKTDTQNFVRQGQIEDMRAFRWLYPLIHLPLLSEIERAPIDRASFKVMLRALNQAVFHRQYAYVFIERLDHADTLVLVADFIMQVNGVSRAIIAGVHGDKLVVVLRSAGLRSNLGRMASEVFGPYGSAGGHKNMARAEMPLSGLDPKHQAKPGNLSRFVERRVSEFFAQRSLKARKDGAHKEGAHKEGTHKNGSHKEGPHKEQAQATKEAKGPKEQTRVAPKA
jgi:nanoRNase/pAp phosphatase (c-di-AMP/oligoRNAs hydrolase)